MIQTGAKRALCVFLAALTALTVLFSAPQSQDASARAFDKVTYANADPNKYKLEVDLTNKIITVYEKNSKGKHTKIAKQFICTIGNDDTATPTGYFYLNDNRRRFGYFREFDVYAQYWTQVSGGIYFHSILYTQPKEGYFTRTSYNALGKKASHGCIRMLVEDARWIYYNCPGGTYGILTDSKAKNEKLRQSLIPTASAKNYKPSADQYENTKRDNPKAKLKNNATFTALSGNTETIQKGTIVTVLSSGQKSCRVSIKGKTGHIQTKHLEFLPNGPKDTRIKENSKEIYLVSSKKANLYKSSSEKSTILGVYGKNTTVQLLDGSTKNYYAVKIGSLTGYMLKTDVTAKIVTADYKSEINELALPSPTPTPTPELETEEEYDIDETQSPATPSYTPNPTPVYVDPKTGRTFAPGDGIFYLDD